MKASKKFALKEFLRFVVPSAVSMIVFSTYSMVDGWFVARGVGELALAAVNLTMPFTNAMFAAALLISVGTSTVCAVFLGSGDSRRAGEIFTQSVLFIGSLAVGIAVAVNFFAPRIVSFLGATDGTRGYMIAYLRILSFFSVSFMVSYCFEVLVKAGGHPAFAAVGVGLCSVTNIVLDYIFVIRWGWGIAGAAYATGIAQTASLLLFAWHFLSGRSAIGFRLPLPAPGIPRRIFAAGLPSCFEEFALGMTAILFNRALLAWVGERGVVAYAVIGYVNTLVLMTMTGITHGMQPLVSFNMGRGNGAACRGYRRYAVVSVLGCSLFFFAVCRAWPETVVSLLLKRDGGSFAYTASALRTFSLAFLLAGVNIVSAGFFTAIERPGYAMGISLARGYIGIALTMLVMLRFFGGAGIWYASAVSESLCLLLTLAATLHSSRRALPYGRFAELE